MGYRKILLEIVSNLQVEWLAHKKKAQWNIASQVANLQHIIIQVHEYKREHIYREDNFVKDS